MGHLRRVAGKQYQIVKRESKKRSKVTWNSESRLRSSRFSL